MVWVTLRDGAKIRVRSRGGPKRILFVHGWAMHGGLFDGVANLLPDHLGAISIDLRGHGESSRQGPATIEQLGADIAELSEILGLQGVVVCGWSMGAMALWAGAADARFQRRVAGYVIVDMSPRLPNDSEWRLGLADGRTLAMTLDAAAAMRTDWAASVERFTPRILASGSEQKLLCARLSAAALQQDPEFMASLWESMARQDFRAQLSALTAPTLAVFGARSQLYAEASSRYIARESPMGRAIGFENSGHAPHLEEPQRFASVLRDFAAMTTRTASSAASAGAVT